MPVSAFRYSFFTCSPALGICNTKYAPRRGGTNAALVLTARFRGKALPGEGMAWEVLHREGDFYVLDLGKRLS